MKKLEVETKRPLVVQGLNPNNIADKRTATRLRQDLVFAGIVDKKGSKYKF